jgi:hypothetical protein
MGVYSEEGESERERGTAAIALEDKFISWALREVTISLAEICGKSRSAEVAAGNIAHAMQLREEEDVAPAMRLQPVQG